MSGLALTPFGTVSTPMNDACAGVETPVQALAATSASTATPASAQSSDPTPSAWDCASEGMRELARRRLAAVIRSDTLHGAGAKRADADRAAGEEFAASVSAVAIWRRRVAGLEAGARVAALLDAPGRGRSSPIDADAILRGAAEALLLAGGRHCTAGHIRRVLVARHGAAISERAVARWMERYRAAHARRISAVTRPDRHRNHRAPAMGDAGASATGLNEIWEVDSTPADLMCLDGEGRARRHAIVGCIDVWSRRAAVLVAPTSRATAIAALLRHCIVEWGAPAAVRHDMGSDYISAHVQGALLDLEIRPDPCPPHTPEMKPYIERFFGSMTRDLFAHLPGFVGHSVADAQALRERVPHGARRTPGPMFDAAGLQGRCDAWIEGIYHRRNHKGLAGEQPGSTPFLRAASWDGEVRRVAGPRALDALLAPPVSGGGTRVVGKGGLSIDGRIFIAPALGARVGERVAVRWDPWDPDRAQVFECRAGASKSTATLAARTGALTGAWICVAEDPARTGADRAAIAAQARAAAAGRDRNDRAHARDLARRHTPEAAMDDVLAHAAGEAGRVVALPRPGTTHETPALREAARAVDALEMRETVERNTAPAKPGAAPRRSAHMRALIALQQQEEIDE